MIHFGLKIYLSQNSKLRQSLSYLQKLQHVHVHIIKLK